MAATRVSRHVHQFLVSPETLILKLHFALCSVSGCVVCTCSTFCYAGYGLSNCLCFISLHFFSKCCTCVVDWVVFS